MNASGFVTAEINQKGKFMCSVDMANYPFDANLCRIVVRGLPITESAASHASYRALAADAALTREAGDGGAALYNIRPQNRRVWAHSRN